MIVMLIVHLYSVHLVIKQRAICIHTTKNNKESIRSVLFRPCSRRSDGDR